MRSIQGPAFPDDDGAADPALRDALRRYAADPADGYLPALAALAPSRLLVPIVAMLGEVEYDEGGRARDKSSDMAAVLLQRADGDQALLAFTGLDGLTAWDPSARPMPVTVEAAAQTAIQEGAVALVVDVAGPVQLVVEDQALEALARGWRPVRVDDGWAWAGIAAAGPAER